eukprot:11425372-Heterocapsa_arctica.AAC.1
MRHEHRLRFGGVHRDRALLVRVPGQGESPALVPDELCEEPVGALCGHEVPVEVRVRPGHDLQ